MQSRTCSKVAYLAAPLCLFALLVVGYTEAVATPTGSVSYPAAGSTIPTGITWTYGTATPTPGATLVYVDVKLSRGLPGSPREGWDWVSRVWVVGGSSWKRATGTNNWQAIGGFPNDWPEEYTYAIELSLYDTSQSGGRVYSAFYVLDGTIPTVEITLPANGSWVYPGLVQAEGTADDGDGTGVASVRCQLYYFDEQGHYIWWDWVARSWQTSQTGGTACQATGTTSWSVAGPFPTDWVNGREYAFYARAYDGVGNIGTNVSYFHIGDITPPTITAPPDVVVEQSGPTGTPAAQVDLGNPTVSDAGDPHPQVSNDAPALFPPGETTVTWTATDQAGNSATAAQLVTVLDRTPPVISLVILRPTIRPANGKMVLAAEVSATDACDPAPLVTIDVSSSDPSKPGKGNGRKPPKPDWEIVQEGGVWRIWLRAENGGVSTPRIYTIIAHATDAAGNAAEEAGTVTVP